MKRLEEGEEETGFFRVPIPFNNQQVEEEMSLDGGAGGGAPLKANYL